MNLPPGFINQSRFGNMQMGQMGVNSQIPMINPIGINNPRQNINTMGINNQMPMNNPMQMNYQIQMNNQNEGTNRLKQEYDLCYNDNELIQIGCNFGLENNNIYTWRITMVGPRNTPYEGGLFTIYAFFPSDYPNHGPEFKFKNKIYHLNVDNSPKDFGHICINSINEWRIAGKVKNLPFYTMKQALFDIFCLFYNQGVDSAYDKEMENLYRTNKEKFNEEARKWTELYAKA